MSHREFFDLRGQRWEVWEVRLGKRGEGAVRPDLAEGWLAFESSSEKRRLAPIPFGWSDLPEDLLGQLCARAQFVRERGDSGTWPRFPG